MKRDLKLKNILGIVAVAVIVSACGSEKDSPSEMPPAPPSSSGSGNSIANREATNARENIAAAATTLTAAEGIRCQNEAEKKKGCNNRSIIGVNDKPNDGTRGLAAGIDETKASITPTDDPETVGSAVDLAAGEGGGSRSGGGGGGAGAGGASANAKKTGAADPNSFKQQEKGLADDSSGSGATLAGGGGKAKRGGRGGGSSGSGKGLASLFGKNGADGKGDGTSALGFGQADRGLAAVGSADPMDYFSRIDVYQDIFKIVEKRYRKKQMSWSLEDSSF